jgi:acyl-CoA thioester hydrolase
MAKADFWFSFPFRVRYSEVDMQGVVFNANYLTYFDTAISEYLRALPYDLVNQVTQTGTDFHTVRVLVEYHAPVRFDDEIEVYVRVARLGRSSVKFLAEIYSHERDRLTTSAEVVWVNTNMETGKSVTVPSALSARFTEREPGLEQG